MNFRFNPAIFVALLWSLFPIEQSLYGQDRAAQASSLTAGGYHTCALIEGEVFCWGYGLLGQLGNGDRKNQSQPTRVKGLGNDVIYVSAGELHTCAVKSSGIVYCWGFSYTGAIGNGTSRMDTGFGSYMIASAVLEPFPVEGLVGIRITKLAASKNSSCALDTMGSVYCWGAGSEFQLGDQKSGMSNHTGKARKVTMIPGKVKSIDGAENGFCATTENNRLYCWGFVIAESQKTYPIKDLTPGQGVVQSLALGDAHSCFTDSDQNLFCIGDNWYQQTGLSDTAHTWTKVDNEKFGKIDSYKKTSCGVTPAGTVKCWGLCLYGLCGSKDKARLVTPLQGQNVFQFSSEKSLQIPALNNVREIAVGARHACALLKPGGIKCWGSGFLGQLGSSQSLQSEIPVSVIIK